MAKNTYFKNFSVEGLYKTKEGNLVATLKSDLFVYRDLYLSFSPNGEICGAPYFTGIHTATQNKLIFPDIKRAIIFHHKVEGEKPFSCSEFSLEKIKLDSDQDGLTDVL